MGPIASGEEGRFADQGHGFCQGLTEIGMEVLDTRAAADDDIAAAPGRCDSFRDAEIPCMPPHAPSNVHDTKLLVVAAVLGQTGSLSYHGLR